MVDRGRPTILAVGSYETSIGGAGKSRPRGCVPTDEQVASGMLGNGAPVQVCRLGPFLKKLLLNTMMVGVDGMKFVATLNTASRESLQDAFAESLAPGTVTFLNSQACALVAAGFHTGLVLDVGHSETRCVPIIEGVIFSRSAVFAPLSARLVHARFDAAFAAHNTGLSEASLSCDHRSALLRGHGRVRSLEEEALADAGEVLPVSLSRGSISVPTTAAYEVLFDGSEPSPDAFTLQGMVYAALRRLDMVNRKPAASCVVLAGGVCGAPNFSKRLAEELLRAGGPQGGGDPLQAALHKSIRLALPAHPPQSLSYVGASLLQSAPLLA